MAVVYRISVDMKGKYSKQKAWCLTKVMHNSFCDSASNRTFPLALDIGSGRSHIAEHLSKVQCMYIDMGIKL